MRNDFLQCLRRFIKYFGISNDESTTSLENAEQKKGFSVFKCLAIRFYWKEKQLFCYISVPDGKNIRLQHDLKETIQ